MTAEIVTQEKNRMEAKTLDDCYRVLEQLLEKEREILRTIDEAFTLREMIDLERKAVESRIISLKRGQVLEDEYQPDEVSTH